MSNVTVIGAGYVGLTTAACLAHLGHKVVCCDIDPNRISMLEQGKIPIVEDGLEELVLSGIGSGQLSFVLGARHAASGSEVVFLCVPTPQRQDGSADMSYIVEAVNEIAENLDPGTVVVNKSTVPVGSTTVVESTLNRPDVLVVSNPEFLREGSAVHDFLHPERIVIGSDDQGAAIRVATLYSKINAPLVTTDPSSAETIKYASNAFLATKISFINAVANLCEAVGADVRDVILGMGYDSRIGFEFLKPGPGWGGSCFPKDTRALINIAEDGGYDFKLLKGVLSANDEQKEIVTSKIIELFSSDESASGHVAVLGLTFKANTDDLRESPAVGIVTKLLEAQIRVIAYDPTVLPTSIDRFDGKSDLAYDKSASSNANDMSSAFRLEQSRTEKIQELIDKGLEIASDPYAACDGSRVLAILTEWDQFKWLDYGKIADSMTKRAIFDGRNLLEPSQLRRLGFTYRGIGR